MNSPSANDPQGMALHRFYPMESSLSHRNFNPATRRTDSTQSFLPYFLHHTYPRWINLISYNRFLLKRPLLFIKLYRKKGAVKKS